ncbi:MAG: DNA polymerase III subunit gamma/tau [bacterium]
MSYLVLARKCRPKTFHDVVGQQHITQTLKNSISSGRIAHSFLFTGPRGVGKTTTARILAKSLNCQHTKGAEPCNTCSVCQEITQGSFVDVLEIDGASNNSVDDIRDLRDKIRYVPTAGRYKIYIVDEVHMLSAAAFNALLKTLEEPPGHAIFIFATTEPHKIPATILSRCQRFDFKRLQPKQIADALLDIARAQGWDIAPSVLSLIARAADGSMRDAQSILDQVMSSSEGEVRYDEVLYLLGLVRKEQIQAIWEAIFHRKPEVALSGLAEVLDRGYDLRFFTEQLLHSLRDLIICKTCQDPALLLGISEEETVPLKRQSDAVTLEDLQQYFHLLVQCLDRMRGASHPQIILEMTLVQLARMERVASFGEILKRLSELEEVLGQSDLGQGLPFSADQEEKPEAGLAPDTSSYQRHSQKEPAKPPPAAYSPQSAPPPRSILHESLSDDKPSSYTHREAGEVLQSGVSDYPALASDQPASGPDQSSLGRKWATVKEGIKKEKPALFPILQQAVLDSVSEDTITLSFPKNLSFYLIRVNEESSLSVLQKWCRNVFGPHYKVECRAREVSGDGSGTDKGFPSEENGGYTSEGIDAIISEHPVIKTAMELFSAQIVQSNVSFFQKG